MRRSHRWTGAALAAVMGGAMFVAPGTARASEEGRKNTALALGAAAAYLLTTQRDKTAGLIAGAGAALAYKRYDDSVKDRHNRERYGYYGYDRYDSRYDRYDSGYDRYDRNRRDDRYYDDRYDSRRDRYDSRYDRNDRYYDARYRGDRYNSGDDCRRRH